MVKFPTGVIFGMTQPTQESKPLELGDFVCPRYLAANAEEAIAQGFIYQVTHINEPGSITTVQRVSNPSAKIIASSDFFISLEEKEGDADEEQEEEEDLQ